jgi:hypothetical protein
LSWNYTQKNPQLYTNPSIDCSKETLWKDNIFIVNFPFDNYTLWYIYFQETSMIQTQTFWNSSDRKGRKSQGPAILPSMPVWVSDKKFCLCILFCTGNRKCNWYAGTIRVNSELHSASNDIYFLNMQLFPW